MAEKFNSDTGAALLFLILYVLVFSWMTFMYLRKSIKWRSRWSILYLHVTVRMASQGCGIGFTILGFSNVNVFLAFLILGAEGYFTLVLCTFRFLISWQQHNLPSGVSWLEPRRGTHISARDRTRRLLAFLFLGPFALLFYRDNIMAAFHLLLAFANGIIIGGASLLANANLNDFELPATQRKLKIARDLRTSGQSVFLACNVALLGIILATMWNDRKARMEKAATQRDGNGTVLCGQEYHKTLVVLLITWLPLIVRGVFGVLQSADFNLSYFDPNNYGPHGFSDHFTLVEYIMGVTMEWVSCVLLCTTYFTSRTDPPKPKPGAAGTGGDAPVEFADEKPANGAPAGSELKKTSV
uniref:Uncharacterized protein n=1 Tax=Mycena chlorophos TaxID=658473 RepID=A0ABQ0LJM7_MYCCL|nr:predicted protein [Mycena chlorophos]